MADYECSKVKIWQKNSRFGTWWLLFGNGHGVCYILGQTNIKYSINFKKIYDYDYYTKQSVLVTGSVQRLL